MEKKTTAQKETRSLALAKDLWQCEELNTERRKPLCHEIKKRRGMEVTGVREGDN